MKCLYPIADYPVYRFSMPVVDSSMYLIPAENSCLVVDPCVSEEAEALLRERKIQDCLILLSHEHYDHISGVNRLRELLSCRVVCSEACSQSIMDPKKNCSAYASALAIGKSEQEQEIFAQITDMAYTCNADQTYSVQTEIQWEGLTLILRETPGHSPGSQVIEIEKHWYFTGDSLIPGVNVITRLPGGNKKAYAEITRPYLEQITPGSILFPGHREESVFSGQLEW